MKEGTHCPEFYTKFCRECVNFDLSGTDSEEGELPITCIFGDYTCFAGDAPFRDGMTNRSTLCFRVSA
jgi:hypothetical protein